MDEITADAKALCVGQETEDEDDEFIHYTVEDWIKVFQKPLTVYIGKPVTMPINLNGQSIEVHGVVRDMTSVLIQHICNCEKFGYLKNVATLNHQLIDWMDGTSILNRSLVKTTIRILWNPEMFVNTKEAYEYVTKSLPVMYFHCPETKVNVGTMSAILRKQYLNLKSLRIVVNGKESIFTPRWMSADYSNAAKRWNHKVGGNTRCFKCKQQFDSTLSDYEVCINTVCNCKSFGALIHKTKFDFGQEGKPQLINDDLNLTLKERGLDQYEAGSEILHVTKGISSSLFSIFRRELQFKDDECLASVDSVIRKNAIAGTMSNADWRLLFCNFEKCLLPFIPTEKENAELMLKYWRDIIIFLYCKDNKSVDEKAQFCVKVFIFGLLITNRWGNNLGGLHLHDLWIHIPFLVWKVNLYNISAEKDEQSFAIEKRIAKHETNHQEKTVIIEILKRTVLREAVTTQFKNNRNQKSKFEKTTTTIPITSAIIPNCVLNDVKYGRWVKLFEKKVLESNCENYQSFIHENFILFGSGELVGVSEGVISKCLVAHQVVLSGKSKCSKCNKKAKIKKDCLTSCCVSCCDDENCVHSKYKEKEQSNIVSTTINVELPMPANTSPSEDTQINNSQDVGEDQRTFQPQIASQRKETCRGCPKIKFSRPCANKMCKDCCKKTGSTCKAHKTTANK